jgi:hypothetical protein
MLFQGLGKKKLRGNTKKYLFYKGLFRWKLTKGKFTPQVAKSI